MEYSYFSIIKSALNTNSDGIIQLSSTTMGATGAAPGQKLPDSYKPAKAGYMSVDGSIDASTAVLPDNTWIFIGQHHEAGNNDVVLTLACALFTDPSSRIYTRSPTSGRSITAPAAQRKSDAGFFPTQRRTGRR